MDDKEDKQAKINQAAAVAAGVVIGAGITAASAALKDKKNREKVQKAVNRVKSKVTEQMKEMQKTTLKKKDIPVQTEKVVKKTIETASTLKESAKKSD